MELSTAALSTADLDRLIAQKKSKSYADLAQVLWNDRAMGTTLRSLIRKRKKQLLLEIPDPAVTTIIPPLSVPYADALVIADLHTPFQNKELLNIAIQTAIQRGITQVDIAGDLHNFNALSTLNKGEVVTDIETDIAHSRQILNVLAYHFDKIYLTSGNHDEYYPKKHKITFQELIYDVVLNGKLSNQVTATNYDWLYRGDDWMIGHLSAYDETPGLIAATIAEMTNKNVAVGHDHIQGYKYADNGRIGISIGAMLTPDRFWYKHRRLSTFPPFGLGFLLLINNKSFLFNEHGGMILNGNL